MNVSIAGRYLVYAAQGSGVGVSRRLSDSERDRLRKMVDRTYKGPGGLIVRTAAHGAKKADFVREIGYLHKLNDVLERRTEQTVAPDLVFQEADLPVRVLRDVFLERLRESDHRLAQAVRTGHELLPAHRAGAGRRGRTLRGSQAAAREVGGRQGNRVDPRAPRRPALGRLPDHRLRRGADRDRRQQRQLHRPRQGRVWRRRSPGSTRRPPRRSSASCACATSAASSSSTSSTWRGRATATKC